MVTVALTGYVMTMGVIELICCVDYAYKVCPSLKVIIERQSITILPN